MTDIGGTDPTLMTERELPVSVRAEPGAPDIRGPWHYLWWLIASQYPRVLTGSLWGTTWMFGLMVPPYLLSRAVDDGLRAGDREALLLWTAALLGMGLCNALVSIMRHRTMTGVRLDASLRTLRVVARHAALLGGSLHRRLTSGELTALQGVDIIRVAQILTLTGPGVGAVIAYTGVAALLFTISPLLAVLVVIGVPLLALTIGPLLGRMHGRLNSYRDNEGALTDLATDIVAGLRVLRGVGGANHFSSRYRKRSTTLLDQGYRVGTVMSWFHAVTSCLPLVFLASVVWVSARLAGAGEITVGEMVAVYGYVAVLVVPVFFLVEGVTDLVTGHVSLRRVVRMLSLAPEAPAGREPGPRGPAELVDPASGVRVPPGRMTALVCARSEEAAAVVDRLGLRTDSDALWGEVRLREVAPAEVRERILVGDNDAFVFAGTLREVVSAHRERPDDEVREALRTACALDLVAGLPDGLDSPVQARARDLSGGQRQRVLLARAVLLDPEILLLIEPTSAVDAHTEAAMAERLHEARHGRTTVVVGTSPLLLDRADRVVYLVDGVTAAEGTHGSLLAENPAYRALVQREAEEGTGG